MKTSTDLITQIYLFRTSRTPKRFSIWDITEDFYIFSRIANINHEEFLHFSQGKRYIFPLSATYYTFKYICCFKIRYTETEHSQKKTYNNEHCSRPKEYISVNTTWTIKIYKILERAKWLWRTFFKNSLFYTFRIQKLGGSALGENRYSFYDI